YGVGLTYFTEDQPLGTAGSVKLAEEFLDEPFVVLSGDGLTDCDLTRALQLHKERGAAATMVLKRVENPLEYGVVITGQDGRVRRFVEKPSWGEVFSDTINTGIYVLEPSVLSLIPENRPYDFGRELFPAMVNGGLPVFAWVMEGYWCDIGDIAAYMRAHVDAMDGRVNLPFPGRPGGVTRLPGAQVDRSAVLEGPCFIGEGARVAAGSRIGAYSVLGEGCLVDRQASVKRAVLWPGSRLMERAQARGCVVQRGATIGPEGAAFEESALGDCAALGARATLLPGVKIWPHKAVADGARVDANLVWGGGERIRFRVGALDIDAPAQAARAAQAYGAAIKPDGVLIGRSASSVALSNCLAAQAGLMAQGIQLIDGGAMTLPQARYALMSIATGGALYVDERGIRPIDCSGADLSVDAQRKIEGMLLRQDFDRPYSGVTKLPIKLGRSDAFYVGMLASTFDLRPARPSVAVFAQSEGLLSLAERALQRAGCQVRAEWEEEMMELRPGEVGLWLENGGEVARFSDELGALTDAENQLIYAWAALLGGAGRAVLPVGDTRAAEALAERVGGEVARVKGERAHYMRALLAEDRRQFMLRFDGLYAALTVLSLLSGRGLTLREWRGQMPKVMRREKVVPVDWRDKGRVLRALAEGEENADLTDGVSVAKDGAWVWVSPSPDRAECSVISEAADMEAAGELCDFYVGKIQKAARPDG
ncbi:MAG: hypothetical protein GX558_08375, partial [Clostridiales bacterium]|nr:hypothetical protein [Clostridiales bacterium]